MGEVFQFVKYGFRQLWYSPRPYIVLFFVYAGLELCFGGARTALAQTGQSIQASEIFIFAATNRIPQWMLVFGVLLLLGDAPFLRDGMDIYILRSSRSRWLAGQILFCFVSVLGYLILVACMFIFMFRGHLSFSNEWSDIVTLSSQIQSGALLNITMIIDFPAQIIGAGSPYAMFGISFLFLTLLLLLCSLLCMACNTKFRMGVGCFAVTALLVWRVLIDTVNGQSFFNYISPCNLATISDKPINLFNVCYTTVFLLCVSGLLCTWTYSVMQKTDLQRKVAL